MLLATPSHVLALSPTPLSGSLKTLHGILLAKARASLLGQGRLLSRVQSLGEWC